MAPSLLLLLMVCQHRLRLRRLSKMPRASNFQSFEYMRCRYHPISSTIPALRHPPTQMLNFSHRPSSRMLHSSRQGNSGTSSKRLPLQTKRQEEEAEEQCRLRWPAGTSLSRPIITVNRRSLSTSKLRHTQTRDHHPHMALFLAPTQGRCLDRRACPLMQGQ